jgi:hypothetical protein
VDGEHEVVESMQVVADVFSDRRVRAPAGLDRADSLRWESLMPMQKLSILPRENVVGDDSEAHPVAEREAQCKKKSRLAAADGAADADGERSARVVALSSRSAPMKEAGVLQYFVRMAVRTIVIMRFLRVVSHGYASTLK